MTLPMTRARIGCRWIVLLSIIFSTGPHLAYAETLEQLIAAAKNETELFFVAGPTTFGGKKGLSEIEASFNKRFGLNRRIRFSAGTEMTAMAERVLAAY